MEVITIESRAFKEIQNQLHVISDYVLNVQKSDEDVNERWVDSYEVRTFLQISNRTLQRLRTTGIITYSIIGGRTYYQIKEIKRLLESNIIRSTQENLNILINNTNRNEKRRNITENE